MHNPKWKLLIGIVAVVCLATPAALGVYGAIAPTRGYVAASLAAMGVELSYLALAILSVQPELRHHARRVAVAAVATSVTLNVIFDYAQRNAGALASWQEAMVRFDPLLLLISIVESAPLALLAFSLAMLLHRLGEDAPIAPIEMPHEAPAVAYAREAYPPPVVVHNALPNGHNAAIATTPIAAHHCPHCGDALASPAHLGAAKRWGYCKSCKPPTD